MWRRRCAVFAVMISAAAMSVAVLSPPAQALVVTTNITAPLNGKHFFISDAHPESTVMVKGTTNLSPPAKVDIRCYIHAGYYQNGPQDVAVDVDGKFSASMQTGDPYGTCRLRAVPDNFPAAASAEPYTGPKLTTEWKISEKVDSGPNAGKTYDYYVEYVSSKAMNDYASATAAGLWDTHLQYADGTSSEYFWWGNGGLTAQSDATRSQLQIDGRNAYGPNSAYRWLPDNPGMPSLTWSSSRNLSADTTVIHESNPIVVCAQNTYPPTTLSCPRYKRIGVRLDRTIVALDGGRQVRITDVWRSTDGDPHKISMHVEQWLEGRARSTGTAVDVQVGVKLPWVSSSYSPYTSPTVYPGAPSAPRSIFIRDNLAAPDGDPLFLRGAISFDVAPRAVERVDNQKFIMRDLIHVRAGGHRTSRMFFVVSQSQDVVNQKAAANRQLLR